jgi:hypothetical protein
MSLNPSLERCSTRCRTDGLLRIGILGLGCLKVSGLSLVPVPPHIMHAFMFLQMLFYEYIVNDQSPIFEAFDDDYFEKYKSLCGISFKLSVMLLMLLLE